MKSVVRKALKLVLVGALATSATSAGLTSNAGGACPARESGAVHVSAPEAEDITTTCRTIYETSEDGTTYLVSGVRIYDASTNELYGITNSEGTARITVPRGARIRAVEPNYGKPPYVSEPIYDDKGIVAKWIIDELR